MNTIILNFFDKFGNFGPIILAFLSMYLLWNKHNLFFYYIVGLFTNSVLNILLKIIIKQPRPYYDTKTFNLALEHSKHFLFKDGMPYDIFGMPSGHSQSALFSTIYIYLSLRNIKILCIYLLISLVVLIQRVSFYHHTILQVIIGSIIGGYFAYFVYYLAREKIKGVITEKYNDYGPI